MGTVAARDCTRIIELTEQIAAAVLLASVQAVELRGALPQSSATIRQTVNEVRQTFPRLIADRALDAELRQCLVLIRERRWSLYA